MAENNSIALPEEGSVAAAQNKADPHMEELLSRADVCRLLHVSEQTHWRMVRSGRYPPPMYKLQPGNSLRWTRGQHHQYLDGCQILEA